MKENKNNVCEENNSNLIDTLTETKSVKEYIKEHSGRLLNDLKTLPSRTISDDTLMVLGCLLTLQNLYNQCCDAMDSLYGQHEAERIISEEFYPIEERVQEFFEKQLVFSVTENFACIDSTEI
jgi:hypothetical protein